MALRALLHIYFVTAVTATCNFISQDNSLHSLPATGDPVEILFSNPGVAEFDIFWVDNAKSEVRMGVLESWSELGYFTNGGMAWRIKLHDTSLVVLEYVIPQAVPEDTLRNSKMEPFFAFTVGDGCTKDDKDFFIAEDVKDSLKLFASDAQNFPSRNRSCTNHKSAKCFTDLNDTIEIEAAALSEVPPVQKDIHEDVLCSDTELWLNKHFRTEGYHVLCISKPPKQLALEHSDSIGVSYTVKAWAGGYKNVPNDKVYVASTFTEFRCQVEELFAIQRTDAWRIKARESIKRHDLKSDGSTKWAFLPQRWRLFDVHRQPVDNLTDLSDCQLLLVFEGGQFIFPGVDLNFERRVSYLGSNFILKTLSMRPLILQVDGLLKDEECAYMIDYSRPRMVASGVSLMDKDKGKPATEFRTSQYVFMMSKSHALLQKIDQRIANITGLDIANHEDVQILKYEVGNYYLSHNDYWSPAFYQSADMIEMTHAGHKNRLATVLWYMNDDLAGGCTSFTRAPVYNEYVSQTLPSHFGNDSLSEGDSVTKDPPPLISSSKSEIQEMIDCDYGLKISPKKGRAIIFYSLLPNGNGDDYSEHAACAVTRGTKWAANKWIWNQHR